MSSNIYPFILFNITFPAFSLILSFSLPLLGLGLHGDALQCVADLGHPADAATGHALVPTPPASDFKKHTSSPPMLCPSDYQRDQPNVKEMHIVLVDCQHLSDDNTDTNIMTVSLSQ